MSIKRPVELMVIRREEKKDRSNVVGATSGLGSVRIHSKKSVSRTPHRINTGGGNSQIRGHL